MAMKLKTLTSFWEMEDEVMQMFAYGCVLMK